MTISRPASRLGVLVAILFLAGPAGAMHTVFSGSVVSNALPPGCIFGSAEGLDTLKPKDRRSTNGGIAFKAKANGATATADGSLVDGEIILGQTEQDGNCGSVLGVLCTARTGTVVCHGP